MRMDYLAAQGMHDFSSVSMETVHAYILTLSGFSYKTVEQNICSLRAFFRFLFGEGIIRTDFASKMPMVKARKQTSIPSVWTKEELIKLIGAIDRASPKGKRDYAIILIACRLGLRLSGHQEPAHGRLSLGGEEALLCTVKDPAADGTATCTRCWLGRH